MKQIITLILLLVSGSTIYSQNGCQPPVFFFDSMSTVSGTGGVNSVYKFTGVLNGVDAFVTITKAQNAVSSSVNMDVTGNYPLAWQPNIVFPQARTNMSDSSYLEFKIQFRNKSNQLINQNCMAMTIVDCDGPNNANSFREMVKVSVPGSPKGITNSTITVNQDAKWILYKSGPTLFMNIDTNNLAAMGQTNFPDTVNTIYMRIGVIGPISANELREFSFYFKSFSGLVVPLPVQLINFQSSRISRDAVVKWATTDEQNMKRYEVHRSFDGTEFVQAGTVQARNGQHISEYVFVDHNVTSFQEDRVYYKLKLINEEGQATWSDITTVILKGEDAGSTSLFPNPASESLNVDLGYTPDGDYSIEVLDVYGKAVIYHSNPSLKGTVFNLDIKTLDKGLYFVNVYYSDGNIFTNRLIKY